MKITSRWFIYATVLVVAGVSATTLTLLGKQANGAYDQENLLAGIRVNCNRLSALEWRAVAEKRLEPDLLAEVEEVNAELDNQLGQLIEHAEANEDLAEVATVHQRYIEATEREFDLIAQGRIDEALQVDEAEVDPTFERLGLLTSQEAEDLHDSYIKASFLTFIGSLLIVTGSVFLIGFLIWLLEKRQRKEQLLTAEKILIQESEERFRSVAQAAREAIVTIDVWGDIVFWNRSAQTIFGYSEEEATGASLTTIIPQLLSKEFSSDIKRVLTGEEPSIFGRIVEIAGLNKDGSEIPLELTFSSWQLGQERFFTAMIRDMTERRAREQQITDQRSELQERNAQMMVLYEVSSMINQEADLNSVLERILDRLVRLQLFDIEKKGGIFLVEGDSLRLVCSIGHSEEFLKMHEGMKVGTCLCGQVVQSGKIITSADSSDDHRHDIRYPGMTPHGHVVVPLKIGQRVAGVLYLYTPPSSVFSEQQLNLLQAIGNQIGLAIDRALLFEETRTLSLHDPLTGLANRNLMNIEMERNMAGAKRYGKAFSLLMLDLDHFKVYNDEYGHSAGDKLLVEVSRMIAGEIREVDLAVRFGGEEFLVILSETEIEKAAMIAERIRLKIEAAEFFRPEGREPSHITISIGVTSSDGTVPNQDVMIARSDNALYLAKKRGRNRVEIWSQTAGVQ